MVTLTVWLSGPLEEGSKWGIWSGGLVIVITYLSLHAVGTHHDHGV